VLQEVRAMLTVIGYEVIVVPAVFLVCIGYFVWCVWKWMGRRYDD
jgi:hypothetical protein